MPPLAVLASAGWRCLGLLLCSFSSSQGAATRFSCCFTLMTRVQQRLKVGSLRQVMSHEKLRLKLLQRAPITNSMRPLEPH
jgi:hypothetical protein